MPTHPPIKSHEYVPPSMYQQDNIQEHELPADFDDESRDEDCISRDQSQPFPLDESKILPQRPKNSLAGTDGPRGRQTDYNYRQQNQPLSDAPESEGQHQFSHKDHGSFA